jgi:hypothetical protein
MFWYAELPKCHPCFFIGLNDNATAARGAFLDKKSRFSRRARLFIIRVGAVADKFRVVEISLK